MLKVETRTLTNSEKDWLRKLIPKDLMESSSNMFEKANMFILFVSGVGIFVFLSFLISISFLFFFRQFFDIPKSVESVTFFCSLLIGCIIGLFFSIRYAKNAIHRVPENIQRYRNFIQTIIDKPFEIHQCKPTKVFSLEFKLKEFDKNNAILMQLEEEKFFFILDPRELEDDNLMPNSEFYVYYHESEFIGIQTVGNSLQLEHLQIPKTKEDSFFDMDLGLMDLKVESGVLTFIGKE